MTTARVSYSLHFLPNRFAYRSTAIACAMSLAAGCTTTSGGGSGSWQVDSIVSKCILAIGAGALIGGVIGAAAGGNRRVAAGAAIGAGAGGVLCAVMASIDAQDRQRIREAQLDAAATGSVKSMSYIGNDGRRRYIEVSPRPAPSRVLPGNKPTVTADPPKPTTQPANDAEIAASTGEQVCRSVPATVTIEGAGSGQIDQVICRNESGDWAPA